MNLRIKGGRIFDPANNIDSVGDVFLRGKKIVGVGKKPSAYKHDKTIDATGLLVLPGLVDLCARLREPGEVHKATIASETRAAAAGGITRLICPPDTTPVVDTPAMAAMIQDRAAACGFARVHPLGALTVGLGGERLADMALLADAGCVRLQQRARAGNRHAGDAPRHAIRRDLSLPGGAVAAGFLVARKRRRARRRSERAIGVTGDSGRRRNRRCGA